VAVNTPALLVEPRRGSERVPVPVLLKEDRLPRYGIAVDVPGTVNVNTVVLVPSAVTRVGFAAKVVVEPFGHIPHKSHGGGLVNGAHRGRHRFLPRRWSMKRGAKHAGAVWWCRRFDQKMLLEPLAAHGHCLTPAPGALRIHGGQGQGAGARAIGSQRYGDSPRRLC